MTTINKALDTIRGLEGQRVGNGQCYGLVSYYSKLLGGAGLGAGVGYPHGNIGDTVSAAAIGEAYDWKKYGWEVVYPKSSADFRLGCIVNMRPDNDYFGTGEFGHTAIITAADGQTVTVHEQNVDGVQAVVSNQHRLTANFIGGVSSLVYPPGQTVAETRPSIKKLNKSLLQAGPMLSIRGVVIHNDAGSMTAEQYVAWLGPRNKELGIAHYYITRDCIARVVDTYNVAWHTGHPTGNSHYIGYEVCQSASASDKDFLANEDVTLMQATEDLLFYGLPINADTVKLHHEFVPTSCPHRSMALHGGTTASTKAYFIERMKHFASLGKTVEEMMSKQITPANSKTVNTDVKVRVSIPDLNIRKAPGLTAGKAGFIKPGVYTITETKDADGYTWGRLKSGAGWIALKYTKRL